MVKRVLVVVAAAAVTVLAYDKVRRNRAERELWREATDSELDARS